MLPVQRSPASKPKDSTAFEHSDANPQAGPVQEQVRRVVPKGPTLRFNPVTEYCTPTASNFATQFHSAAVTPPHAAAVGTNHSSPVDPQELHSVLLIVADLQQQLAQLKQQQQQQQHHITNGPDFDQYMAMTDVIADAVRAGTQQASTKPADSNNTSSVKFKIEYSAKLPTLELKAGEPLTSQLLLKWVSAARELDAAALKAMNRPPANHSEWLQVFQFYCKHLESGLYLQIWPQVQQQQVSDVASLWDLIFAELFPAELVPDVFDAALQNYYPWNEPAGIIRWQTTSEMLLTHMLKNQEGITDLSAAVASKLQVQVRRFILHCQPPHNRDLHREFQSHQAHARSQVVSGDNISAQITSASTLSFINWLKAQLSLFSYAEIFGHKLTSKQVTWVTPLSADTPKKPAVRQISMCDESEPAAVPAPSYSLVTQLGSQEPVPEPTISVKSSTASVTPAAYLRKLHGSAAAKQTHSKKWQPLDPYAPNGKKRTWGWHQRTAAVDGQERKACNTPVEDVAGCTYFGDVLDAQNLCSYCMQPGHVKDACSSYSAACAKYQASKLHKQQQSEQPAQEN